MICLHFIKKIYLIFTKINYESQHQKFPVENLGKDG